MKTPNNITTKNILPKQHDKMLLTQADIFIFSTIKKAVNNGSEKIVVDCCNIKNWKEIKNKIDSLKEHDIKTFGVLLNDFISTKNSDLKLFSKLKLGFPSLKIIYRIDEVNYHFEYIQSALDLGFDFLYLEKKNVPKKVINSLEKLHYRNNDKVDNDDQHLFSEIRKSIDKIDTELLELLSKRNKAIQKIGEIKSENDLKVFQPKRWKIILRESFKDAKKYGIHKDELKKILEAIHLDAIKIQLKIYSKKVDEK